MKNPTAWLINNSRKNKTRIKILAHRWLDKKSTRNCAKNQQRKKKTTTTTNTATTLHPRQSCAPILFGKGVHACARHNGRQLKLRHSRVMLATAGSRRHPLSWPWNALAGPCETYCDCLRSFFFLFSSKLRLILPSREEDWDVDWRMG